MGTPEQRHPFYRPLWRRVIIVAVIAAWFGFELYGGSGFWVILAGAALGYAVWEFLITFPKDDGAG